MRAHSDLRPEDLTAIVDTREQTPLHLAPLKMRVGTLATGDYSIAGLEEVIRVERKSLPDLVACCGRERERFDAEILRLLGFPVRLLMIEATWSEIELGGWRSAVAPQAVMGSVLGWMAKGIPVLLAGSHQNGGAMVARFMFLAARRRWRELHALAPNLKIATESA